MSELNWQLITTPRFEPAARQAAGLEVVWPELGPGETVEGWLERPTELRIPHVGHGVEYDTTSPWYHFA